MNAMFTSKMWAHEHHPGVSQSEFEEKMSRLIHSENLWTIVAILLVAGLLILGLYLNVKFGPVDIPPQFYGPINNPLNSVPGYFTVGPTM